MLLLPLVDDDHPREECGIAAAYTPNTQGAARDVYFMLSALQHRGQEAAGISSYVDGVITTHKEAGLVSHVFREEDLQRLTASQAVGHVRYSTTGDSLQVNASPMVYKDKHTVAVAHNGNLVNAGRLRRMLEAEGKVFHTSTDSEVVAAMIASRGADAREGLRLTMQELKGAYSLCVLTEGKLLCSRDANGIRPLVLGKLPDRGGYVVASETCALDILGAKYLREVVPGEMVELSDEGFKSWDILDPQPRGCSLESIYFARPDSKLGTETVAMTRERLGRELAKDYPVDADFVIPVPNSGRFMALGFSHESGIPVAEGLVKNDYIGRTFIQPTQEERKRALRMKLNVMPSVVAGQRLVMVDDSLIRGNTMRHLTRMLREAGAEEVHIRIASPPTRWQCHYGVDMGRSGEYIATDNHGTRKEARDIASEIGADSLHYLTPAGLSRAFMRPLGEYCTACFTGDYPVIPEETGKESLQMKLESGTTPQ